MIASFYAKKLPYEILLIYFTIKWCKIENELEMKLVSDGWNRKSNQADAECVYSEMINDTYFLHLPYESVV